MTRTILVVPCFDEARRLDPRSVLALAAHPVEVILVDDGSRDGTGALISDIAAASAGRVSALLLPRNVGKGEAVRTGLIAALERRPELVGYTDADFATPVPEMRRLAYLAAHSSCDVILGSRVMLLGRAIERRALRHYLGRVFATCASLVLRMPVYDTQCGAKVFRSTQSLASALATPFASRWGFDVELIGRLRAASATAPTLIREEPLESWADVSGSKVGLIAGLRATLELALVAAALRRYRKHTIREPLHDASDTAAVGSLRIAERRDGVRT